MSIKETICPRCGRPSEDGLCGPCRLHEIEWVTVSPRVETILCPSCGSRKVGSTWSDSVMEKEDLGRSLVIDGIRFHPDVRDHAMEMTIRDISSNRSKAYLVLSGTCYGIPVKGDFQVLIVWGKEQCDRCCRISGSYYEGIIQVRGEERRLTEWESRRSAEIAWQAEDTAQQGGDRLSFVSSIDSSKDGVDIIVSSLGLGQSIVNDISSYFGAKSTSHPKLVGEKEGKRLYRVTWSIRLPRIVRGDVVVMKDEYYQVTGSDGNTLRTKHLLTMQPRSFRDDASVRLIGNIRDAEEAMVTYHEGDTLGILDPKTHLPLEIPSPKGCHTQAGGAVSILRDADTLVLVGY
ncbi:NMD protein affecting ribosome stability and mRNA decay [Methanocalculus taiwanensis]|uniref:NMD protein affecting ribosome stability and mRNA decay n=1 Tax=Methanocalculus taiwanensis TaxID=106207 RepID=A0ABD4TKK1_9EURY|nr:60S ribosomal export protein NMD3 [Methanocalculus taiwanensis]MCQ1538976.1 NMD protein affecting ribosome stability and mRNA decay [Methanocalculus taiwanensis]